jgi:hypothetical protein
MCQIATTKPSDRSITAQRALGAALAQLFASPNWQTFMVVAQEQGPFCSNGTISSGDFSPVLTDQHDSVAWATQLLPRPQGPTPAAPTRPILLLPLPARQQPLRK